MQRNSGLPLRTGEIGLPGRLLESLVEYARLRAFFLPGMKENPVPRSAPLPYRVYFAARPLAAWLFTIPFLGYWLRILVGVLKLPRFNMHLRRLDTEMRKLNAVTIGHSGLDAHIVPLNARVAALEDAWRKLNAVIIGRNDPDAPIVPLNARVTALEGAWRQHIPDFLNAVGTVPAFAHELARFQGCVEKTTARLDNVDVGTRAIWERIEFIRREILFEIAHGTKSSSETANTPKVMARIVASNKVEAARKDGTLRLNLGCGHIALPGYVNVDMRELPGVDVVAEASDLPFERDSVTEIFSAHFIEHFPQEAMRRRLLPYWRNLLRPGGTFRAVTPDTAAMLAGAGAGTYSFNDFREVVFGSQDYAGDYHYNLFTPESLRQLLEEAGFTNIEVPVTGRRSGKCFEFEISASRAS